MSGSAREAMLSRIRHANGGRLGDPERQASVAARLAEHPKGIIPARGQLDRAGRVALFRTMAERVQASVAVVATYAEVPAAVAVWLRDNNLPATLRMGTDPRLQTLDFQPTALDVATGPSDGSDLNGLSHAEGAVAESGSLMLVSGSDNPTSLNFLPENHVVVLAADDVAGDMEALFDRLRERFGAGEMPRSVNFVTGPSRSADIEQTLLLGAHGPRALHIVIVG